MSVFVGKLNKFKVDIKITTRHQDRELAVFVLRFQFHRRLASAQGACFQERGLRILMQRNCGKEGL
jgi:hypothetical protein